MDKQDKNNPESIVLGVTTVKEVYLNVSQNVIVITEDKLRLELADSVKKMERKNVWIAPLGILITLSLSFVTTDFRDFGLKASTWQAVFIIAAIIALGWLIISIIRHTNSLTIDELINNLKKQPK